MAYTIDKPADYCALDADYILRHAAITLDECRARSRDESNLIGDLCENGAMVAYTLDRPAHYREGDP